MKVDKKSGLGTEREPEEEGKADMPLVSVIIPVYNAEKYLKRCLDSILSQTYKNLEIICINDGSEDRSDRILQFYANKDERIKVISGKKSGPAGARNKGLDAAKGTYISFVDADDWVSYNAYSILVEVAEKERLDIIMFGGNVFPNPDFAPQWILDKLNTRYHLYRKLESNLTSLIFEEPAAKPFLWLHFIRSELFAKPDKIRFEEKLDLGEDQLMQFSYVPRAKSVMVIEDKLYNYRWGRKDSLMSSYNSRRVQKIEKHLLLVSKIIETWKKNGLFQIEEDQLVTYIVNFFYYSLEELPLVFQVKYAKKVIGLMEEYQLLEELIAEYEQEHFESIKKISETSLNYQDELIFMQKKIEDEKNEIILTRKSKAFKLGSAFTPKKKRLPKDFFELLN